MIRYKKKTISIILAAVLFWPFTSMASTLSLVPAEGTFGPGDSFALDITLDVEQCVNTVEATIEFPQDYLMLLDFLIGDSILNIWVERPDSAQLEKINDEGKIYLAGGIPGGYCGKIKGDTEPSGIVARLIFKVPNFIVIDKEINTIDINFLKNKTRVFINDGLGTEDELELNSASYSYSQQRTGADESWRLQIDNDNIPPEPFVVTLVSLEGEYYIHFHTTDKQTGIDHYEVLEILPGETPGMAPEGGLYDKIFGNEGGVPQWKRGNIPYKLEDQNLASIIKVKAVDSAGNQRIVEYIPPEPLKTTPDKSSQQKLYMLLLLVASSLFIIVILFIIIIKKKFNRIKQ